MLGCRTDVRPLSPYQPERRVVRRTAAPPPPAAASPLSLTASDGTGLRLADMGVRAIVEDPLAFTELDMSFENLEGRALEGRFEILLPQGAQVTRFATMVDGQWREAEVVEKQYARAAYEAMLHEQRDPALLERDAGNRFRGRVFPIEPYGRTRVLLSYAESLPDPDEPYRLALRGLPQIDHLDVLVSLLDPTRDTPWVEHRAFEYEQPTHDVVLQRPLAAGGLRQRERVVARLDPLAGVDPGELRPFERLTVLFDTSASRALEYDATVDRLGRLLDALSRHSGTAQLELWAFDQAVVPIFDGPLASMGPGPLATLRARRPLGASNLQAALDALSRGERDRVLLVTDGLISAGTESESDLRRSLAAAARSGVERLDVLRIGTIRDDARLLRLATGPFPSAGVLLDAEDEPDRLARRMLLRTLDGLRIDVPGATWWHPRTVDGLQPGDHLLVHAELPEGRPMSVHVSGPVHAEHAIELREVESPLLDHAWMHGRIEHLIARIASLQDRLESERLRALAVSLSVRHRIFNDLTAFLVLETEEDYARFGLDRRALGDILVAGPNGVEVEHRGVPEPEPEPAPEPVPAGGGSISGQVHDETTGEPLGEALVVLQCSCLQGNRETVTDAQGLYRFSDLPAGTYTVQALAGQTDVNKVRSLRVDQRLRVDFTIDPRHEFKRRVMAKRPSLRDRRRENPRRSGRLRKRAEAWSAAQEAPASAAVSPVRPPPAGTTPPPVARGPIPPPPPPPPLEPASPAQQATAAGRTVSMEEFRNIPVGNSSGRDFTQVVESSATVSHDAAGISLAGTTGAESVYSVEGANVSNPSFGLSLSGSLGSGPAYARVMFRNIGVSGDGLGRLDARVSTRERHDAVERCYFRTVDRDRGVRGRVRVQLRLDDQGQVTSVLAVRRLGVRDADLLHCVDEALRGAQFPVREGYAGRAPRVTFTMIFQPGSGAPGYYDPNADDPDDGSFEPTVVDPPTRLRNIEQALAERRTRDAWSMSWRWRRDDPADVLALVALGRVAETTGNTELAARAYGSILDLFPSRADMLRHAAGRLEALDETALALAVDAYRRARAQRPDHPSSHRNLAFALLRQGDPKQAFDVLEAGLARGYPPDRFAGVGRVLREDLGLVGSAWIQQRPVDARRVEARLAAVGATLPTAPSLRFVLTWETDANDVDLHVQDTEGNDAYHERPTLPSGGELYADVANGYGPECFTVLGEPSRLPHRILVHYYDRGPMGYGMGKVQVVRHDGEGDITLSDRSFVITEGGEVADLGLVAPEAQEPTPAAIPHRTAWAPRTAAR